MSLFLWNTVEGLYELTVWFGTLWSTYTHTISTNMVPKKWCTFASTDDGRPCAFCSTRSFPIYSSIHPCIGEVYSRSSTTDDTIPCQNFHLIFGFRFQSTTASPLPFLRTLQQHETNKILEMRGGCLCFDDLQHTHNSLSVSLSSSYLNYIYIIFFRKKKKKWSCKDFSYLERPFIPIFFPSVFYIFSPCLQNWIVSVKTAMKIFSEHCHALSHSFAELCCGNRFVFFSSIFCVPIPRGWFARAKD